MNQAAKRAKRVVRSKHRADVIQACCQAGEPVGSIAQWAKRQRGLPLPGQRY